ncbi:hypothetical protein GCM10007913_42170 [Devosia yakushimensis]|uniref:DUF4258 domain-containing protein n=1 Tax=Devosia yakushimensis TaxID=470028 RepID=A0ABQ5UKW5_9HYPH|nr:DUF4258 domain-containing protein [Devosia yakushimensis]GLQ12284.1 hypothetical protein GCM10007913_42170 [Devosia yakushimensis]
MAKPMLFTQHALDAVAERQLDPVWVELTVFEPHWQEADPGNPDVIRRFRAIPERGGRYLRVALVETSAEIRILSAFLDRRARPK